MLFFCINLVFAVDNTRGNKENIGIKISIPNSDFVETNAVIDPITKNNIAAYVVKDNAEIFLTFNDSIDKSSIILRCYYYYTLKNKNLIIRCFDANYSYLQNLHVAPESVFNILSMQKKLDSCLFIYDISYIENGVSKTYRYSFKVASNNEYNMYVNYELKNKQDKEIKRPKKQD